LKGQTTGAQSLWLEFCRKNCKVVVFDNNAKGFKKQ
jgi:hypothetical protein